LDALHALTEEFAERSTAAFTSFCLWRGARHLLQHAHTACRLPATEQSHHL